MAVSDTLGAFVQAGLAKGLSRGQLRDALASAGWSEDEVRAALSGFAELDFPIPVPRPRPYLSAREAFMYVVLFTMLYVSAFSLGHILFQLINAAFPDPIRAGEYYYRPTLFEAIRWSLSSLIVAFPVFLFMARLVDRAISRQPYKRGSKIRKQLTYLTLFIGSVALVSDVTAVVYNLLGGELTVRFLLKVLTVAAIAGTIFGYYLADLRRDEVEPS